MNEIERRVMGNFYNNLIIVYIKEDNSFLLREVLDETPLENNSFVINKNEILYSELERISSISNINKSANNELSALLLEEVKQNNLNDDLDYVRNINTILKENELISNIGDFETISRLKIVSSEASNFYEVLSSDNLDIHKSLDDFTHKEMSDEDIFKIYIEAKYIAIFSKYALKEPITLDNFELLTSNGENYIKIWNDSLNEEPSKPIIIKEDLLKSFLQYKEPLVFLTNYDPSLIKVKLNGITSEQEEKLKVIDTCFSDVFGGNEKSPYLEEALFNLKDAKKGLEVTKNMMDFLANPVEVTTHMIGETTKFAIDILPIDTYMKTLLKASITAYEMGVSPTIALREVLKEEIKDKTLDVGIPKEKLIKKEDEENDNNNDNGISF